MRRIELVHDEAFRLKTQNTRVLGHYLTELKQLEGPYRYQRVGVIFKYDGFAIQFCQGIHEEKITVTPLYLPNSDRRDVSKDVMLELVNNVLANKIKPDWLIIKDPEESESLW